MDRQAITEQLLFFDAEHLDDHLKAVSKPFCDLARQSAQLLPANTQTAVCLQHLLEAKDAAVRAALVTRLSQPESEPTP